MSTHPNTPVLVGVGQSAEDVEAVELMARAAESAAMDAGSPALLPHLDWIGVPQGTWGYADPGRLLTKRLGCVGAKTVLAQIGVSQQTLVSHALRAIEAGSIEVALVTGGEARARARRARQKGVEATETLQVEASPDLVLAREPEFIAPAEVAAGLVLPAARQYAVIENALRHAEGLSIAEHRTEIAALWARLNVVARGNPHAAFPTPRTSAEIEETSRGNRPLAFPYNKWHASQWTVDQAAALLVCSASAARRFGVPLDRWVFPLVGIDADHAISLSERRVLHRWPAMRVLRDAAESRVGRSISEIEVLEIYSCFPSAVRVQQRELGIPKDATPTVTGGMPFAGGPLNNFVYQATAAVIPRLRAEPDALGAVTTVCGMLTKPGIAIWSAKPDGQPPLLDDFGGAAAEATAVAPIALTASGRASVCSYTVAYEEDEPSRVFAIADLANGERVVAVADDRDLATAVTNEELIGTTISVNEGTFAV